MVVENGRNENLFGTMMTNWPLGTVVISDWLLRMMELVQNHDD